MKSIYIVGFLFGLCATINSVPLCKYSLDNENKYVCMMENSVAGTTDSNIDGNHLASYDDTKVLRVTTTDAADRALILAVLKKFENLEVLQIQKGSIAEISSGDFGSKCLKLKQFQLWGGTLTNIANSVFIDCSLLEEIDLASNQITNMGTVPASVKKLSLAYNKVDLTSTVSALFSTTALNLLHLNLSGNDIQTIPTGFALPSTKLTQLDFSKNKLTAFPEVLFDANTNIESLYLNDNQLTAVTDTQFKKLTKLTTLKLGKNAIATINTQAFAANTLLQVLDISANPLTTLNADLLKGLTTLKSLDIHDIKITSTSYEALKTVLTALINLETLDISSNNIGNGVEELLKNNVNLVNLAISSMELSSFTDSFFSTLSKLRQLTIDSNKIVNIPEKLFEKTTEMRGFSAKSNKITTLKASTFEKMTNLESLDFTANEIKAIERTFFDQLKNLKSVKFAQNSCIKEDFSTFKYDDATKEKFKDCFNNFNGAQTIIISNILLICVIALKFI